MCGSRTSESLTVPVEVARCCAPYYVDYRPLVLERGFGTDQDSREWGTSWEASRSRCLLSQHLHYITLCYTLYYTILYYTILYYTILYYTILYYTILIGHQPGSPGGQAIYISRAESLNWQLQRLQLFTERFCLITVRA